MRKAISGLRQRLIVRFNKRTRYGLTFVLLVIVVGAFFFLKEVKTTKLPTAKVFLMLPFKTQVFQGEEQKQFQECVSDQNGRVFSEDYCRCVLVNYDQLLKKIDSLNTYDKYSLMNKFHEECECEATGTTDFGGTPCT